MVGFFLLLKVYSNIFLENEGVEKMKVSLFATCLVDVFQGNVGKATVELLERLGCTVDFPQSQICCGQPAYNTGYVQRAKGAIKTTIQAFEKSDSDYVVSPSGSCVCFVKEYPKFFAGDKEWEERAISLANKTYELTQFIVNVLGVTDVGAKFNAKATYHPSCHMTRLLGIKEEPVQLLQHVEGLEYIELPNKELCCGFGGTFSVKMPQISEQIVDEKIQNIIDSGAEVLIGADYSCLLNIGGRLSRLGKDVKVYHIAEILNAQ